MVIQNYENTRLADDDMARSFVASVLPLELCVFDEFYEHDTNDHDPPGTMRLCGCPKLASQYRIICSPTPRCRMYVFSIFKTLTHDGIHCFCSITRHTFVRLEEFGTNISIDRQMILVNRPCQMARFVWNVAHRSSKGDFLTRRTRWNHASGIQREEHTVR